jgi:hypothetical protein
MLEIVILLLLANDGTASKIRSGLEELSGLDPSRQITKWLTTDPSIEIPAATFHLRSYFSRAVAFSSANPSNTPRTITVAIVLAGVIGHHLFNGSRLPKKSAGKSYSPFSAKTQ